MAERLGYSQALSDNELGKLAVLATSEQVVQKRDRLNQDLYHNPETLNEKKVKAYDIDDDINRMLEIQKLIHTNPELYRQRLEKELALFDTNFDRFIGELCGLEVYKATYMLRDRQIKTEQDEALVPMMYRGLLKAEEQGYSDVDKKRIAAEIKVMSEVQNLVANKSFPNGTILVLPSPPGGSFPESFIDFLKINEDVIYLKRRTSTYTLKQQIQSGNKASLTATGRPVYNDDTTVDHIKESFINCGTESNEEELFSLFGTGAHKVTDEKYQYILRCQKLAKQRFRTNLKKIPPNKVELTENFRIIVNLTDKLLEEPTHISRNITEADLDFFGSFAMQSRLVGCGLIGEETANVFSFLNPSYGMGYLNEYNFNPRFGPDMLPAVDPVGSRRIVCSVCATENWRPYMETPDPDNFLKHCSRKSCLSTVDFVC